MRSLGFASRALIRCILAGESGGRKERNRRNFDEISRTTNFEHAVSTRSSAFESPRNVRRLRKRLWLQNEGITTKSRNYTFVLLLLQLSDSFFLSIWEWTRRSWSRRWRRWSIRRRTFFSSSFSSLERVLFVLLKLLRQCETVQTVRMQHSRREG